MLVLSSCTYPFDDYLPQSSAVTTNDAASDVRDSGDGRVPDAGMDTFVADTHVTDTFVADTHVADTFVPDTFVADTGSATDTRPPCVCLKWAGPMCKEWSPAGCGD